MHHVQNCLVENWLSRAHTIHYYSKGLQRMNLVSRGPLPKCPCLTRGKNYSY
jgi:hypothetical protein